MCSPLKKQDYRIYKYIEAAEDLKQGKYNVMVPVNPDDEIGKLGKALVDLARNLEEQFQEFQKLEQITTDINAGLLLDQILEKVYQNFKDLIPYNRIGFSLIENSNEGPLVRARWAKSDQQIMKIKGGYSALLAGSSLERIIATGQPRIINNLVDYLAQKPKSNSTQLIVQEGMRSSLTCPLIANGVPIGLMFFSSIRPNTYAKVHVSIFQKIANQLSIILEKGRLVSQLAAQKREIEQQNKKLCRLNELKNTFLGMAAHDLRGPLGNIHLAASLLIEMSDQLPSEETNILFKDIHKQTNYMLDLINDLLDVTHIESGRLELNLATVDLKHFLQEAVQRHTHVATMKGTKVILEHVPAGTVQADPNRLRQIVDNLISNGVKYSPPGSTVRVNSSHSQQAWQVSVKDEGPGITRQDREQLFQDFARLSAQPTGNEKSTGLGLAITRRIVNAHGGSIGVDSQAGQGATFWFTLPNGTNS